MGQDQSSRGTAVAGSRDPEQIREEIEATRHALGDTVEALAAKTDLKAQMRQKLNHTRLAVTKNPVPFAILGTLAAGLIVRRVVRG
jgi:hypothetical protein